MCPPPRLPHPSQDGVSFKGAALACLFNEVGGLAACCRGGRQDAAGLAARAAARWPWRGRGGGGPLERYNASGVELVVGAEGGGGGGGGKELRSRWLAHHFKQHARGVRCRSCCPCPLFAAGAAAARGLGLAHSPQGVSQPPTRSPDPGPHRPAAPKPQTLTPRAPPLPYSGRVPRLLARDVAQEPV
jgi:hypothetical protein